MPEKKIAVIDGNSLMHRAYHAVPPTMNAPDGTPTNACFGFMSMLLKFIDLSRPDAIICAFDAGRPAFRMEALAQYKGQRPPMDEELKVQFPVMEGLLASMNIPVVRVKGWEGDDILGTIATRDEQLGYRTLLVSGDKDVYQLCTDLTHVVTTKKGISDVAIYGPAEVRERYGVTPEQFPDFLGLKGDSSDNIPGVPGVGDKTAAKLLAAYGNLEGIYEHIDELKGKQKERMADNREAAFVSRKVATIVRDVDFELDLEAAAFPAFDVAEVTEAFSAVRFNAHLSRVLKLVGETVVPDQVEVSYKPIVRDEAAGNASAPAAGQGVAAGGSEAAALIDAAIEGGETIGVAVLEPEQASLFDTALYIAFSCEGGTALYEGASALRKLADVILRGSVCALDSKALLHRLAPVAPPAADGGASVPTAADAASAADAAAFDLSAVDPARIFDLGLAAYVLNSSVSGYTLDSLMETYLGGVPEQAKSDEEAACLRAACARALAKPMREALEADGSMKVYRDIDVPLVKVLVAMECTGAPLDVEHLRQIGASTQVDIDELRASIIALAGEDFNIDSPKQLGHILFEVLGLPPKKKTQRGYSTDAKVLQELSEIHELPALVLRYRELAKIKSTYIDALPRLVDASGRVHTTFNETVTATGRLSSSDPNLQNIPVRTEFGRHIRECFVPSDASASELAVCQDWLFVSADYSQIELRLLAHLSGDAGLIEAFNSGADFHASTASRVFGIPVNEVTPQLRSRAKAVNFGIVYGQQAYGLAQSLHIPFGEAKEMIERYFEVHPGVRAYLDATVAEAREKGYAETMFGRKRHIPELAARNATQRGFGERTAMNHPMQGSAADIIKLAMIEVARRLREEGFAAKLLIQVHDELDFGCPACEVERLSAMVRESMENVVSLKVPLLVDVSAGKNWAEAH